MSVLNNVTYNKNIGEAREGYASSKVNDRQGSEAASSVA